MDFVLVSENSTMLSYGDEKYDVTELPQNTSLIVEEKKRDLLGKLSLVQTFENMKNAVDLFYVVNLAVDGVAGLHSNVSGLQRLTKGNMINNNKMDCQPYRKRRPAVKRAAFLRDRERRKK